MVITIEALTKRYGSNTGIEGLDLTVEAGEVFGFLGPNGAGKTTTIRCMIGLLKPTAGKIRILDLDPISQHSLLGQRIGYLPGELRLYEELTGGQHLKFLGDLQQVDTPRRDELCERFKLSAAVLKRPISGYSRGMKQKIGLVQAFQHNPDVAILDEPTEGLDPLIQQEFFELLAEERTAGHTVFLSSHILGEVQRTCQRVAILRDSKLVTVQEVEALRNLSARRVRLTFADGVERSTFDFDGWHPTWSDNQVELLVPRDDVVSALQGLLQRDVVDVVVEESDLDEAFLAFYKEEESHA